MKPVEFKYQNSIYAEDQKEYNPLPSLKIEGAEGHVVSCWKLSLNERIKVLFFGVIWMDLISFNKPLSPSYLSVTRKDVFSHPDDKIKWWSKYLKRKTNDKQR